MKKNGIKLLLLMLAMFMLSGCGKKETGDVSASAEDVIAEDEDEYFDDEEDDEVVDGEYLAYSDGAVWGNNYEGSAVYLEGTTAIVTVAVSTAENPWEEKDLKDARKKAQTAIDFIEKAGKSYKKDVKLLFDEDDLNYEYTFEGEIEDFEYEDYDGVLAELLDGMIDAKKIREDNKAEGIAYLFLLNGRGYSFASPHLQEDETEFFHEGAYMYALGYDEMGEEIEVGPSDYVHQLLRLFGAVDLLEPDPTHGYTTAFCNVVRDKYSNDVMFTTLDSSGKVVTNKVVNEITDVTAYSVGWIDTFAELEENSDFKKEYRGVFIDNYMKNTEDGEDYSAYEWDDAWDDDADDYDDYDDDSLEDDEWLEDDEEILDDEDDWSDDSEDEDWLDDSEWEEEDWDDEE